jgi:hypothetical protein
MEKDFRDILFALNAHKAKYLVVGGYAVSAHSEPRATKDLDLWIKTDPENSLAVYRALLQFGAPLDGISAEDFNQRAQTGFQIGVAPVRIDLLHHIDGLTFDEAWENRVEGMLDENIPVYLISREDLVKNKLESGRPRDLLDIKAIRAASQRK